MFKKNKVAELTAIEKIEAAQVRVAQSMEIFRKAEQDVLSAQDDLAAVIESAQSEIATQTEIIKQAESELAYNDRIRQRLSEIQGV